MNSKRFSIRFNLDNEDELKAWNYLHRDGDHSISKDIIESVNKAQEFSWIEALIRRIMCEELKKVTFNISQSKSQGNVEDENSILDFLSNF